MQILIILKKIGGKKWAKMWQVVDLWKYPLSGMNRCMISTNMKN